MKVFRSCSIVLARFMLSIGFLVSATEKIFHWQEAEHELLTALIDWQSNASFSENLSSFLGMLTPWTSLLLLAGSLLELGGGLLIFLGIREKLGAGLLLLFLAPTTLLFHQFWFVDGGARELQMVLFLKNFAIMGGLILLVLHGAQASSREDPPFM